MSIIGIDLGTTNSLVAHFHEGQARIIPNSLDQNLTPSVVGIDDNGEILVGAAARERLITHPLLTASVFKRRMGTDAQITLGRNSFRAEELSALVLRSLKADAEIYLKTSIDEAVISVPAYFSDSQRKATKAASELAGLKVDRLINEPTAAAIAYGLHQRDAESKFLVFDLGGGTFDVSVLELFDGLMEVHASAGDNFLGGEDFDSALVNAALQKAGLEARALSPIEMGRLRSQAEACKIALSRGAEARMVLLHAGQRHEWTVRRDEFEALIAPLLERLRLPVERAMRDAKLRSGDLDAIVLAGGATRTPAVRSLVGRMLGKIPAAHLNPDEVVALGAAVQAALLVKDNALSERVLTDVCPYTLGVNTSVKINRDFYEHGHYAPLIERNTVVPCSRTERFYPISPDQPALLFNIYQGESRLVVNNIKLGSLEIPVPKGKEEDRGVDIRFSYDMSGILEVEAVVPTTKQKRTLVIEKNAGVLSGAEIAKRLKILAALKIHPRDTMANRNARARAERLYEEALGDTRTEIAANLSRFEQVLERQDPLESEKARLELETRLDFIERSWRV